jgi:ubiquitin-conjugating enzyme E2 T
LIKKKQLEALCMSLVREKRLHREWEILRRQPPPLVHAWPRSVDTLDEVEAIIEGAPETPYAGGRFRIQITIPARYPFEPPLVRFLTRVYHPNIDSAGRVCLDLVQMPPQGNWRPSANLIAVLAALQQLLVEPNPDDALEADIAQVYRTNREVFASTARAWTLQYAQQ